MRAVFPVAIPLLACLAAPVAAHEHGVIRAITPNGCPGDPIAPDSVITGEFPSSLQGAYVMVPFAVADGTSAVRVKYCWDEPEGPGATARHTIDLGLWDARPEGGDWGPRQFRGWGGSSHPDVTVSLQGFSTEAEYLARPRGHVPGRTTRGFLPGPIRPGEWAVELGVGGVVSRSDGDADGKVRWRVEVELAEAPLYTEDRYHPARYDRRAAVRAPGWYAGDMHVHAEHSALGDATMTETFAYAFRPLAAGGAGLDFIMLSDYVTSSAWGEIGRYQRSHPGKLIARSSEVITYLGHLNNHTSVRYVDHRTGPVYERRPDGSLTLRRATRTPAQIFAEIRAGNGFTQVNHPTIFPSSVPGFRLFCRGCPWDYSAPATDFSLVDAIEIQTGPTTLGGVLNPFTRAALEFYEAALAAGHRVAAVGSSDSHRAGRVDNPTQAPVGTPTTVVHARRLSERAIRRAVKDGHTYVKLLGNAGPDRRFEAQSTTRPTRRAMMGDVLRGEAAEFTVQVLGATASDQPRTLHVIRDGQPFEQFPITAETTSVRFASNGPGRYRLQLEVGPLIEAVSSPIYLEP
jgi:hypothetical protein